MHTTKNSGLVAGLPQPTVVRKVKRVESAHEPNTESSTSSRLSHRAQWSGGEAIIGALMAHTLAQPDLISLAAGFVDYHTLPIEPTRKAMGFLWSDPKQAQAALQYGTTIGHGPLREAILERMLQADGRSAAELSLSAGQVVITAGSNQLLYLISDVLVDPGDIVLCGAPSYFVYLGALASLGARAMGVESDQDGLIPEALDETLARLEAEGELGRVKLVYAISYYDNPTGATLSLARRQALVELVQRWSHRGKIYLMEDAAYRELRYHGQDVPSLRSFDPTGQTVISTGSFSKSFSPGVRVGWGILPKDLVDPILAVKGHVDFGSPNFSQCLMATVLERGLYDDHIATLCDGYRVKLDATLASAQRHLGPLEGVHWVRPDGGLYLWVELPEEIDAGLNGPLFDRAIREGVLYVPGEYFFPSHGGKRKKNTLRLSFGIQCCASIDRGIAALASAIRQLPR